MKTEAGQLLEVHITPDLVLEIREFLEREGMALAVRDVSTPFLLSVEVTRRRGVASDLTAAVLEILQRRAIKPLDLQIQDAALVLNAPQR